MRFEETVIKSLFWSDSFQGVFLKHQIDQVNRQFGFGNVVFIHDNFIFFNFLNCWSLIKSDERQLAEQELVENYSCRPHVYFLTVWFPTTYLGWYVHHSATELPSVDFLIWSDDFRKSEVCYLDVDNFIIKTFDNQDILWFKVPVNYPTLVQVVHHIYKLVHYGD